MVKPGCYKIAIQILYKLYVKLNKLDLHCYFPILNATQTQLNHGSPIESINKISTFDTPKINPTVTKMGIFHEELSDEQIQELFTTYPNDPHKFIITHESYIAGFFLTNKIIPKDLTREIHKHWKEITDKVVIPVYINEQLGVCSKTYDGNQKIKILVLYTSNSDGEIISLKIDYLCK